MHANSHLFNALSCLKFFINSQQTRFFFPAATKCVMEFFNLTWRSGVISGYRVNLNDLLSRSRKKNCFNPGLTVYLKHGRYRYDTV